MMVADRDYGVRVIKPFAQFSTGFVMFPTAIYRGELLKRGWVEEVKPESAKAPANQGKPKLSLR